MIYELTEQQFIEINQALPARHDFGYFDDPIYLVNIKSYNYYNDYDLDGIFGTLYNKTKSEFMQSLPIYSTNRKIEEFKICKYAERHYDEIIFNLFNFKTMLKKQHTVNKKTHMLDSGRPEKSMYYINNELMAIIYFTFTSNSDNILTNRREDLVYIDNSSIESEFVSIKNKDYDTTDINDAVIVLEERIKCRNFILQSLKMTIGNILKMQLNLTLIEVAQLIIPFWDEFNTQKINFIDLGTPELLISFQAIDLQTTEHSWLSNEISTGVTLLDYMISKLNIYYS